MYIGALVVTSAACPHLFQLDWLSQSCANAVCLWSYFITSLRLLCREISIEGTQLKGHHFGTMENIQIIITDVLHTLTENYFLYC